MRGRLWFFLMLIVLIPAACHLNKSSTFQNGTNKSRTNPIFKRDSGIYLGTVLGESAELFTMGESSYRDSIYELEPITHSKYPVEIRFFRFSAWSDTGYCILLYYDSVFHLTKIKNFPVHQPVKNGRRASRLVNSSIPTLNAPDSIFANLLENGIFSLPLIDTNSLNDLHPLELRNGRLKKTDVYIPFIQFDGLQYSLEYKVDTFFRRIYLGDPTDDFLHYPDLQPFRRRYAIASILGNVK
jgi:hypothetical protein